MFQVIYQHGKQRQKVFKVTSGACRIGSARSNDIVLKNRLVAKRHVEFRQKHDGVYLADLGSTGGTWLNRERCRESGPLSELDEIAIGDVKLRLRLDQLDTVATSSGLPATSTGILTQAIPALPPEALEAPQENVDLDYWSAVVHEQLIQQMDLRRKDVSRMSDAELRADSGRLLDEIIRGYAADFPDALDLTLLTRNVLNEALGLGPLEKFLDDDSISEIMVNDYRDIFVERAGRIEKSSSSFSSEQAVYSVIERIITPLGKRIDESSPIVDARLKDGSRVNAVIPPLALKGPALTIRKFSGNCLQFPELVESGSISHAVVEFMRVCVENRRNVIVSGGTGSGKTTLLNVLSNFIPDRERVVTIEDAAELKLALSNQVALESRPSNAEGKGAVSIRDLVRNALRMRPDRIVVGECRGAEALDMLQAMNTGHDGSLTTIHANSPRDVVSRLEVLVLMTGMDLPVSAIREQIASAVDIIIQQTRYPCGTRRVSKVTEVVGIESGTVQLQDIFGFRQSGVDAEGRVTGDFFATGFIPGFYESLRDIGIEVDLAAFSAGYRS